MIENVATKTGARQPKQVKLIAVEQKEKEEDVGTPFLKSKHIENDSDNFESILNSDTLWQL